MFTTKSMKKISISVAVAALGFTTQANSQSFNGIGKKGIVFSALDVKGKDLTTKQWEPLRAALEKAVGSKVKLSTIKNAGMTARAKTFDLLLTNPVSTAIIVDQGKHEILATLNHKKQGPKFAGVIIVKKDSPIKELKDLAGKKVAVVNMKKAAGGFLFQAKELLKAGLDPKKDFKKFTTIQNQKTIVQRVLSGDVEAGFIRTGMIEDDLKKSGFKLDDLRILNKMTEGLDYARSTDIYPHWAVSIHKSVPADVKAKIKAVLLGIKPGSAEAKAGKMKGFVAPLDYSGIKKGMSELNMYKFKN